MSDNNPTRRRFLKATGGTASAVAIAGCSSSSGNGSSGNGSSNKSTSSASSDKTSATDGTPEQGGTIEYLEKKISPSLDPHHTNGAGSAENYIPYNTLVRYNQDLEFDPVLATDWETENGGKRYVFQIREGVEFHDGSQLDAEVIKWNFDRMLSDYSQVSENFDQVDSVSVTGDYEVTVDLSEIFPVFLDNLNASGHIVSKKSVEENDQEYPQKHPVGTGPYQLASWDQKQGVAKFKKYENYWKDDRPRANKWIMRGIPSGQTRISAFKENGNYLHSVPAQSVSDIKKNDSYKTIDVLGKSNSIDYLTFNCENGPFSDPVVRKAAYYAISNEQILNFLSGVEPIQGPLPASNWANNPEISPKQDIQKAKSLMSEAGMSDGFNVTLKIWKDDPGRRNLATITKQQLEKININVNVKVLESSALIKQMNNSPEEWEFASLHWGGGGHIDPYGNLNVLFDSNGQYNYLSNFSNEKADTLLRSAIDTTDRETRKKKYQKAEMQIFERHPMIWFGRFVTYASFYDKIHNVKPIRPTGYFPRFERVYMNE